MEPAVAHFTSEEKAKEFNECQDMYKTLSREATVLQREHQVCLTDIKKTHLTLEELKGMAPDKPMYRAIGRMFLATRLPVVQADLKATGETAKATLVGLEAKLRVLGDKQTLLEHKMEDLLTQHARMPTK